MDGQILSVLSCFLVHFKWQIDCYQATPCHSMLICYIYLEIKRWVAEKGMIKSQLHTNFYHFCIRSLRQNMLCSIFTSCNMFQNHLKLMVSRRHVSKIIYHMPNSWTWFVICNVLITYFAQPMSPHLSIYLSVHA